MSPQYWSLLNFVRTEYLQNRLKQYFNLNEMWLVFYQRIEIALVDFDKGPSLGRAISIRRCRNVTSYVSSWLLFYKPAPLACCLSCLNSVAGLGQFSATGDIILANGVCQMSSTWHLDVLADFSSHYCISQSALNYIRNKREKQKVSKDKQLAMSNGSIRAQHEVDVDYNNRDVDALSRWLGVVDARSSIFIAACFFCSLMRKRCFSRWTDRIIFTCNHLVECAWPSIIALTRCRGISWSGALNIFDDWHRSMIWNGLTDQTSCFDRKLCTDWSYEASRFCSTETGGCCSLSFVSSSSSSSCERHDF
ncbi:hypothetical protein T10_8101 [Trichinella papuae]|uniref:Uncharacterized protein n=1 Tax=Trichinella papuae TaxID=268474 RepID=A0A0V1MHP1_9BILA|nr:hypothetical protein T10_8101 [Trichinella papuae]